MEDMHAQGFHLDMNLATFWHVNILDYREVVRLSAVNTKEIQEFVKKILTKNINTKYHICSRKD